LERVKFADQVVGEVTGRQPRVQETLPVQFQEAFLAVLGQRQHGAAWCFGFACPGSESSRTKSEW
jgi:hypothetical protein